MSENTNNQDMQARLICINNLCARFSTTVEQFYDIPDADELLVLIKRLEKVCGEYLKASQL